MSAKVCATCLNIKPLDHFFFRDSARTKLQHQCKECTNAYKRRWYNEHAARHTRISEGAKRRRIARNVGEVRRYLAEHPCVDCGETDPVVLEFDHVRRTKSGSISRMLRDRPWGTVLAEIEKCEVRCANCHRRRTSRDGGWWQYLVTEK